MQSDTREDWGSSDDLFRFAGHEEDLASRVVKVVKVTPSDSRRGSEAAQASSDNHEE